MLHRDRLAVSALTVVATSRGSAFDLWMAFVNGGGCYLAASGCGGTSAMAELRRHHPPATALKIMAALNALPGSVGSNSLRLKS